MRRTPTCREVIWAAAAASCATAAHPQPVDATDPARIAALIQAEGYKAALTEDSVGDPLIESAAQGVDFSVFFYECTQNADCGAIQFYAGFDLSEAYPIAQINQWNTENRYLRAYLDDEDDPRIEMDMKLRGGITDENFRAALDAWTSSLGGFLIHIGWE